MHELSVNRSTYEIGSGWNQPRIGTFKHVQAERVKHGQHEINAGRHSKVKHAHSENKQKHKNRSAWYKPSEEMTCTYILQSRQHIKLVKFEINWVRKMSSTHVLRTSKNIKIRQHDTNPAKRKFRHIQSEHAKTVNPVRISTEENVKHLHSVRALTHKTR